MKIEKELLQKFCSDQENRVSINTPWSDEKYSYATDGRLCIRVPRLPDVPERDDAPKNMQKNIFDIQPNTGEFQPLGLIVFPPLVGSSKCTTCHGCGTHTCSTCEDDHECGHCEGSGREAERMIGFKFGKHTVSHLFFNKLTALECVSVAESSVDEMHALSFRFNGGDGLLMPMLGDSRR